MTVNQANYPVGMAQDSNGMPIPEVSVQFDQANAIMPVDVQNHLTQNITALNAVALTIAGGATPTSTSSSIVCDGFITLNVIMHSSVSHNGLFQILWSYDNSSFNIWELVQSANGNVNSGTYSDRWSTIPVRAPYCKIIAQNSDGTIAPTVSVYAYLQA